MKARQIMTENPCVVTPADSVAEAAELMRSCDVGMLPVVDDRGSMRLVGVMTDRDLAIRHVAMCRSSDCEVEQHMSGGVLVTARLDEDARDVMGRMAQHRVRRLPVLDELDRVVGVIAQADIACKVGPADPTRVEQVLARISEPAQVIAAA